MPLSDSSSQLRGTYGARDPGNERFRSRAFQRALLHSERITNEKVTVLQRRCDFRNFRTLSRILYKNSSEMLKVCSKACHSKNSVNTFVYFFSYLKNGPPESTICRHHVHILLYGQKNKIFIFFVF